MFAAVGEDADHAQHRHADHLPGTAHAQGEAIEVDVDHVEVGERARAPRLQRVLQRGHHARHRALRERRRLEQWLEASANPPGVAARQVGGRHRFIHLPHPPLIAWQDRRGPFLASEQGRARQRERERPGGADQRPLLAAVAIAPPDLAALVRRRPQDGQQLLVDRRLDRASDVLVDQFPQRDRLELMRSGRLPDTLAHGAFLRWPPWQAVGWRSLH